MAVTIYDVAALAGVSPATVSRVLNGASVSPERAQKVRQAAAELGFRPNRTARTLRKGGSDVVALVIPDVENPFFTAVARGVEDRALAAGYSVVLCNTDELAEKEARYLELAVDQQVAGVVLAPASTEPDLASLTARGIPVVAVDRPLAGLGVDVVTLDDRAASVRATHMLYDRGYGLVACVTGFCDAATAQLRAEGWREVFEQRSPGADPALYLRHTDYRPRGGRRAAEELLALPDPPDAVFAANNLLGAGVLSYLVDERRRPPAVGLGVLGELPYPQWETRAVAVQPWPGRLLGVTAADLLLDRIKGAGGAVRSVVVRSDQPVPAAV
ncbi:MAG TPA: LacI family DNA-binding transcriptional regulator [Kineosporiaceae bacterium]|jgi:LacI family transcriptional regulator|nr:LacI family DNA-binding transcriptional regulator [Kineosporiaceae bacterium]